MSYPISFKKIFEQRRRKLSAIIRQNHFRYTKQQEDDTFNELDKGLSRSLTERLHKDKFTEQVRDNKQTCTTVTSRCG